MCAWPEGLGSLLGYYGSTTSASATTSLFANQFTQIGQYDYAAAYNTLKNQTGIGVAQGFATLGMLQEQKKPEPKRGILAELRAEIDDWHGDILRAA